MYDVMGVLHELALPLTKVRRVAGVEAYLRVELELDLPVNDQTVDFCQRARSRLSRDLGVPVHVGISARSLGHGGECELY